MSLEAIHRYYTAKLFYNIYKKLLESNSDRNFLRRDADYRTPLQVFFYKFCETFHSKYGGPILSELKAKENLW